MDTLEQAAETRGEAGRRKLLAAAVQVFGEHGFHGASTRMVAEAAQVNLQAIAYYFGGKDKLYLAAAEHVALQVSERLKASRDAALGRLAACADKGTRLPVREARALLVDLLMAMAAPLFSSEMQHASQFILREQMAPGPAYRVIFRLLFKPQFAVLARLVAVLLKEEGGPELSERVRLRAMSLMGGVLIFRISRASLLAQLGWETIGAEEQAAIRRSIAESVASL